MIVTETITIGGGTFTRTYSDAGRFVVRDGVSYSEAIDPVNSGRIYTEGEIIDEEISAEEALESAQHEAPPPGRRSVPGSLVWVPATAGMLLAQHVVLSLTEETA